MTTEEITTKTYRRVANPIIVSSIAGIVGSATGKFLMHPVDTVKAKLQVISMPGIHSGMPVDETIMKGSQRGGRSLIMKIVRDTIHAEGMRGLYRGFGIHVGGTIPAGALYYGSYEMFKKFTLKYTFFQQHQNISYFLGGIFAETISCIIFVPVDVIKERRQVQANMKDYAYRSDVDAFRQIMKSEGLRGIYRAYGATVASFGPFSAFYFMFYEYFKGIFVSNDPASYLLRTKDGAPAE